MTPGEMESNLRDSARAAHLHVDEFAFGGAASGRARAQMSPQRVRFAMAAAAVVVLLGLMFVLTH